MCENQKSVHKRKKENILVMKMLLVFIYTISIVILIIGIIPMALTGICLILIGLLGDARYNINDKIRKEILNRIGVTREQ